MILNNLIYVKNKLKNSMSSLFEFFNYEVKAYLEVLYTVKDIFDYYITIEHFKYMKYLYSNVETYYKELIYIQELPLIYRKYLFDYNVINKGVKSIDNEISNFIEFC